MSTFYEDDPVVPPKPPAPPSADPDNFANAGQLARGWTRFCYRHRTHSVVDVLRPNYFASCVDRGFDRGDEIAALIGEPESARKLNLVVCAVDRYRKIVRVSLADSQGRYSYVGDDTLDVHAADAPRKSKRVA